MIKKSLLVPLSAALLSFGWLAAPLSAQDAFNNLVPDDAMGFVYLRSMGGFQSELRAIVSTVDPDVAEEIDIESLLGMLDLLDLGLDMTKPACVVMGAPEDEFTPPTPILIMPCADAKKTGDSINAMGFDQDAVVRGSYVAFSPEGMFKAGSKPSPLMADLPDTDLVIRINLAGLIGTYRADIDMVMDMMAEEAAAGAAAQGESAVAGVEWMMDLFTEIVDSANMLDITTDMNGTAIDAGLALTVGQGTPLAKGGTTGTNGVATAAGYLPTSHPVAFAMSFDMKGMVEVLRPFWKASANELPEGQGEAYMQLMDTAAKAMGHMGGDVSVSIGAGAGGLELVQVYSMADAAAYMELWQSMLKGEVMPGMGMSFSVAESKTEKGIVCQKITMSVDWDKLMQFSGVPEGTVDNEQMAGMMAMMFGSDGLVMHTAIVGDNMVVAMGGDSLFKEVIANPKQGPSAAMKQTLKKAGGAPGFAMNVDVRGVMGAAKTVADRMGMGDQMPDLGEGAPVPIGVYAGRSGLVYRGGMHMDVGALVKLLGPFMPR